MTDSNPNLPCKNCITLAICKAKISQLFMLQQLDCSLLDEYINCRFKDYASRVTIAANYLFTKYSN